MEEMLRDVLKWLDDNFFTGEIEGYYSDVPEHIVQGKFDCKEDMINMVSHLVWKLLKNSSTN